MILGVEGDGVYVSNDNAKTFTRSCDGLRNLTITSIAADAAQPKNVYAAVAFGGSSSGIYRSTDAGATWKKLPTNDLPQVLSLVITEDAEVKFVAGTEKGFFWSADGEEWSQAPPASYPIRVDKVLRFNKVRYFAATAEGVFTSRDSRQELVSPGRRRRPRRRHRRRQPRRQARAVRADECRPARVRRHAMDGASKARRRKAARWPCAAPARINSSSSPARKA